MPALAHALDDIAVAHRRRFDADAMALHGFLEPEIAHDRRHQSVIAQFPLLLEADRTKGENPIAAHDLAVRVGEDHAVGIAIE